LQDCHCLRRAWPSKRASGNRLQEVQPPFRLDWLAADVGAAFATVWRSL
jgi:hypothetical protein